MKAQMSKAAVVSILCATIAAAGAADLNTDKIDSITGLKGKLNVEEGVYKVSQPRTDLKISVDKWEMPPFMGLTSWAAFQPGMKNNAMVMGDLILMQDEVNPVMSAALDNGLQVTALHNHFFYDEPKVYFMHIGGEGPVDQLARGVRAAFDTVKRVRADNLQPIEGFGGSSLPAKSSLDPAPLQKVLAVKGEAKDGMFKAVFGRSVKMPCGCMAGKEMGVNTWAAFAGADDNALVDGDFVVLEQELQPVLKSLRTCGINIVAIHHHMVGEQPRTIFLHYWGRGRAEALAQGVRTALDTAGK
jgi:uncharacterized protein DUF1259